ncbi:hypothetical protein CGH26_28720, partial [Vibrio parahaemolyticus]
LQLTPKQQQEFLQNVRKDYQERNAKYADKTEAEIREIILENTEEWMEEWIGELNSDQKRYAKQISQQTI